jgi:hypothetical protein
LWSPSFRARDGAIKFVRADRRHPHAVDDQTVRRLTDSSALTPAYSLQLDHGQSSGRLQRKVRPRELLSPPQEAHGDKEISAGKKRTPEFRHRDRVRHGEQDG